MGCIYLHVDAERIGKIRFCDDGRKAALLDEQLGHVGAHTVKLLQEAWVAKQKPALRLGGSRGAGAEQSTAV